MEKMVIFRKDNCPTMANKPQLWFGDFCRGNDIQKGVELSRTKDIRGYESDKAITEVLSHAQYFMSSSPGIISKADADGSCFTTTFCNMLEKEKHQLDSKWNTELNNKLEEAKYPTTVRYIYDPFPGEMFDQIPGEFSFSYDWNMINRK
ncbi:unnamed protein product [Meganyctiphanes norvegica]|uniref:Caspase family p20 domain-containing protein n=1 Tax=Meganyctiphanes norvegica TaxID=48144 RepID=A0AAV2S4W1_MEGNR